MVNVQISYRDTYTGEHSSIAADVAALTAEALIAAIIEPGEGEAFVVFKFEVKNGAARFTFGVTNCMGDRYLIKGSAK